MAGRILERIAVHNTVMQAEPWEGPGEPATWSGGDPNGRAWKLVTLTSPAAGDQRARFEPETLRAAVLRVRSSIGAWWRRTPWGRQVREPGTRAKRARKDTSYVAAPEVAPGGMVHAHVLVYGEFVPQPELARWWAETLGLEAPVVVDIRAVDPEDPAGAIREALKYATKGEGTPREQAARAAAVEFAFAGVRRVSIGGALRAIQVRSQTGASEDVEDADVHDDFAAACESCGLIGEWRWSAVVSAGAVTDNEGWGCCVRVMRLAKSDGPSG